MAGTLIGKHILYDASLVVNGVDLSARVESVSFEATISKHPGEAMGDLQDYSIPGTFAISDPQVTFYQDFNTSKVYATLYAAWSAMLTSQAAPTTFNLVCKGTSGAKALTNPEWTIPCFVGKQPIISGKHGDRHMASVTFVVAGLVTVATS